MPAWRKQKQIFEISMSYQRQKTYEKQHDRFEFLLNSKSISSFCISTEVNKESWNGPIFRTVEPINFCAQKVTNVLLQPQLIDIGQKATLHWNFFAMVVVNVKGLCVKMKMKPVLLMDHGISIPTPQSTLNTIKAKSIYRSCAVRCLQ